MVKTRTAFSFLAMSGLKAVLAPAPAPDLALAPAPAPALALAPALAPALTNFSLTDLCAKAPLLVSSNIMGALLAARTSIAHAEEILPYFRMYPTEMAEVVEGRMPLPRGADAVRSLTLVANDAPHFFAGGLSLVLSRVGFYGTSGAVTTGTEFARIPIWPRVDASGPDGAYCVRLDGNILTIDMTQFPLPLMCMSHVQTELALRMPAAAWPGTWKHQWKDAISACTMQSVYLDYEDRRALISIKTPLALSPRHLLYPETQTVARV